MGLRISRTISDAAFLACLALLLAASLWIRLQGIPQGEPFIYNVDEPDFVGRAVRIVSTGDLNPHWFGHPGSLTIYCLALLFAAHALFAGIPFQEVGSRYLADPTTHFYLGKLLILFWSIVGQAALYVLARLFLDRWHALFAVSLLTFAILDINYATLVRTDTQQSALLIVLAIMLVQIVRSGSWTAFLGAGALLGLSVAVKWPSVAAAVPIALAGALHYGFGKASLLPLARKLAGAAAISLVVCFLAAPFVFLDFKTVLKNVATEARTYHLGATSAGFLPALGQYFGVIKTSFSWIGIGLAALGAVCACLTSRWREYAVVLALFAVYLSFISIQYLWWARWAVPLLPYIAFFAAVGLSFCTRELSRRWQAEALQIALPVSAIVLIAAVNASNLDSIRNEQRQREKLIAATGWLADNLPQGAKILTEMNSPYFPRDRFSVYVVAKGQAVEAKQLAKYYVPRGRIADLNDKAFDIGAFDYVVIGGYYSRLKNDAVRFKDQIGTYDMIFAASEVVRKLDGGFTVLRVVRSAKQ